MRSRLLARLDSAIAKNRHPIEAACLRAERACFLARQGRLADAQKTIDALRAQFALHPQASVSAWLHLAEGLHEHFSRLGPSALDKVRRAHGLSAAAGLKRLQALCAAWLAHMEMARSNEETLVRWVAEARQLAQPDDHSVHSRIGLVLAYCYHSAGRADRAQPWYASARAHAVAEGDDAALSALMHNQTWMRCIEARDAELFGSGGAALARQALLSAESTAHFDVGIGTASLTSLVPMLRAQLLTVADRCTEALALFDGQLDAAMVDGLERLRTSFVADMAWCCCRLGLHERARALAQEIGDAVDLKHADDRAFTQAQLARVWAALGDDAAAARLRELALDSLRGHRSECERLVGWLDTSLATPSAA